MPRDDKAKQAKERRLVGWGKRRAPESTASRSAPIPTPVGLHVWRSAPGSRHFEGLGCAIRPPRSCLLANVRPKVASERAGHGSVGFTLDRCSHVIASLQEEIAQRIDAALRRNLVGEAAGGRQIPICTGGAGELSD